MLIDATKIELELTVPFIFILSENFKPSSHRITIIHDFPGINQSKKIQGIFDNLWNLFIFSNANFLTNYHLLLKFDIRKWRNLLRAFAWLSLRLISLFFIILSVLRCKILFEPPKQKKKLFLIVVETFKIWWAIDWREFKFLSAEDRKKNFF